MNDVGAVAAALQALGSIPGWQIIGAITAAGTLAMAILQLIKDLTPLRRIYQRFWLQRWIRKHAERKGADASADAAHESLIQLATGGAENAFYELATEQLVAQMNAAVLITMDYPRLHRDLLVTLSTGAEPKDIALTIRGAPRLRRTKSEGPSPQYLEARTRVGHQIQRNLDAIQISMSSAWKFWMQIGSIIVSTLVLEVALITRPGTTVTLSIIVTGLLIGIVGGYFAPVSRDLVAALQTLRK